MNKFRCVLASGGSLVSIPLIVTCDEGLAGASITATDGTTTIAKTCPSTSPYTVEFDLPNDGTWTITGIVSGMSFSDTITISEYELSLHSIIDLNVDFYSAANDTVSYIGIDNQTHTITTDSSGHASATITIDAAQGSTLSFSSTIAKDTTNISNYYSKSITLTQATTSIYLMPDNTLYWYGCNKGNVHDLYSDGVTVNNGYTPAVHNSPTFNANAIRLTTSASGQYVIIGTNADLTGKTSLKAYTTLISSSDGCLVGTALTSTTVIATAGTGWTKYGSANSSGISSIDISALSGTQRAIVTAFNGRTWDINAIWLE